MADPTVIATFLKAFFESAKNTQGLSKESRPITFEGVRHQVITHMKARYLCDQQQKRVVDLGFLEGEKNGRVIDSAVYDVKSFMDAWNVKAALFPVIMDIKTIPSTIICRNEEGAIIAVGDMSASQFLRDTKNSKSSQGPLSANSTSTVWLNVVDIWLSLYNITTAY